MLATGVNTKLGSLTASVQHLCLQLLFSFRLSRLNHAHICDADRSDSRPELTGSVGRTTDRPRGATVESNMKNVLPAIALAITAIAAPLVWTNWSYVDAYVNNRIGAPDASQTSEIAAP
jgi:hypothetical protein